MKVQVISRDDISEGMVWDLIRDNAEIYYFGKNEYVFNGIEGVKKVSGYVDDADYYIFDDTMFGLQIEKMRKDGYNVVGGNRYGDRLELDREFFFDEMRRIGVKVPNSVSFNSITDAMDYIKENGGRWVFKPSGGVSDDKSLTYVSANDEDMLRFLEWTKNEIGDKVKFVLQEYKEGIEVAITGLVVDGKVVGGYFVNFEYKPFMKYSNLNTGEMGTVVKWFENVGELSDEFDKVVSELGVYRGWFDLNGILTDDGWYLLEATSRIGVPIISILHSLIEDNIAEFYEGVANGSISGFNVKKDLAVGIVLAVPPFPFKIENAWEMSQYPINEGLFDDRDVHYYEIMKKGDEYWTSGDSGFVAVVVGFGKTVNEANMIARWKCMSIDVPKKYFRSDIGLDGRYEKFIYDENI